MTLSKKTKKIKGPTHSKKLKFWIMDDGLHDMRKPGHPLIVPYPIFMGTEYVQGISVNYPVKMEFTREGKFYYVIFYDPKLGMIGKATIPTVHVNYLIDERISKNKAVTRKEIEMVLRDSKIKHYR